MRDPHVRSHRVFRQEEHPQLFAPTVDERVPQDHWVRRLRELVEDVAGPLLRPLYEDHGGIPYDPVGLLCADIFGYTENVRSNRELEERCRYDVRFMHLVRGVAPDHNTFARFRKRIAASVPRIFAEVLRRAGKHGLVSLKRVAVDGTKLEGNITQWAKKLEEGDPPPEKPPSDPDARWIPGRKGAVRGYNPQIAVDADSGLIVGHAMTNETRDTEMMKPVLESVESLAGSLPECVVADAGYDSPSNHDALAKAGVRGFIAPLEDYDDFWELDEEGELCCPTGNRPVFERHSKKAGRVYDCYVVRECGQCRLKSLCEVKKNKTISILSGFPPQLRVGNAERARSDEGRRLMRARKATVERAFAQMKGHRKLRRFRTRGMENVSSEMGFSCLAYNLERMLGSLWETLSSRLRVFGWQYRRLLGQRRSKFWGAGYQDAPIFSGSAAILTFSLAAQ